MSDDRRPATGMSWWDKAAIGAMGGVGGALSYDALQQMAVAMHIRPELTYLFPVAIDGFIAYGTRALVVLKEAPLRARVYTWSVFGSATATSVWANWTHAVRLNDLTPPGEGLHLPDWSVGVLSTIAPLVLGGATHLYIVMSRHTSGADAAPDTDSTSPEPGKTRWWNRRSTSDHDTQTKPAVRTRWRNRSRTEAAALDRAAPTPAAEHPELHAVPEPSPVSLTKAPAGSAALPPGPAAVPGAPPTVPVPEPATSGTAPSPQPAAPASGTVPENGTVPTLPTVPGSTGTVPTTPAPPSNLAGTVPAGTETAPLVHAAPAAVPMRAVASVESGPLDASGPVPDGSAASRPGGEAGRVSAATATAPHHTPASAPASSAPSPAVPVQANAAAEHPDDPGTVPARPTALRAVPTPGTESAGTGPQTRARLVPVKDAGPQTGTAQTPGTPPVPSGDRPGPGPGTVPKTATTREPVPASPSPVPGSGAGSDRGVRKRELSEDELKALLPIGRTVAATAEGRLTRETLRAGLRAQNVPINNTALGQLLRELKDIEGKPPPARR